MDTSQSAATNVNVFKDDKQTRSVFVGNIPYDSSEEELKSLFSQIGPIISFRLVYDRETGKAKGYGFCEFADIETANSAIRNLNGCEFRNRFLRVDSASCEKNKEEIKEEHNASSIAPPPVYNKEMSVDASEVPDAITNIISNMPSEKIFELLKQIKTCAVESPDETKEMLIQNPHLAYAILQALLLMNVIDSKSARAILLDAPKEYPNRIMTYNDVVVDRSNEFQKQYHTTIDQNLLSNTKNVPLQSQTTVNRTVSTIPPIVEAVVPSLQKEILNNNFIPQHFQAPLLINNSDTKSQKNDTLPNSYTNLDMENRIMIDNIQTNKQDITPPSNMLPNNISISNLANIPSTTISQTNTTPNIIPATNVPLSNSNNMSYPYPYSYQYGVPENYPPKYVHHAPPPQSSGSTHVESRNTPRHYDKDYNRGYYEHDDYPMYHGRDEYNNYDNHHRISPPIPIVSGSVYSREDYSRDPRARNEYYDRQDNFHDKKNNYYSSRNSHFQIGNNSNHPNNTQDPRLRRQPPLPPSRHGDIRRSDRRKPRNS